MTRISAGELSRKALSDTTKYNALEVGHALADEITPELFKCIENHKKIIDENEFCIVMLISKDPLITNLQRRKFYAWPYLPKPRPNQSVFLYNKGLDKITHRLWTLPNDMVMAELSSMTVVAKPYQSMKNWSDAYFECWVWMSYKGAYGTKTKTYYIDENGKKTLDSGRFVNKNPFRFWDLVRRDQNISMPSEHEYFLQHREELIKAGCKIPDSTYSEPFDFSKIAIEKIIDTKTAMGEQGIFDNSRQTQNSEGSISEHKI